MHSIEQFSWNKQKLSIYYASTLQCALEEISKYKVNFIDLAI